MNLFVMLGDYAIIDGAQSDVERVVTGLQFDNYNDANYTALNQTWYLVKKPGTNASGLTTDMKSVYLSDGSTVEISKIMKHINNMIFNSNTGVLRVDPGYTTDLKWDLPITLPTDIPMAFKRANTVVNLGRL